MLVDNFVEGVKLDILEEYRKNAIKYDRKASQILQDIIDIDFNITDGGLLNLRSFQKSVLSPSTSTIQEFSWQTRGVPYAFFVYYGLGTNRRYGKRNYLEQAAREFLQYLITGSYDRPTKQGSPNKGRRTIPARSI
jgi:hypothetical protein